MVHRSCRRCRICGSSGSRSASLSSRARVWPGAGVHVDADGYRAHAQVGIDERHGRTRAVTESAGGVASRGVTAAASGGRALHSHALKSHDGRSRHPHGPPHHVRGRSVAERLRHPPNAAVREDAARAAAVDARRRRCGAGNRPHPRRQPVEQRHDHRGLSNEASRRQRSALQRHQPGLLQGDGNADRRRTRLQRA